MSSLKITDTREGAVFNFRSEIGLFLFNEKPVEGLPGLSKLDQERLKKIKSTIARAHFKTSRGFVRQAASVLFREEPEVIEFATKGEGKPIFKNPARAEVLDFSISHSGKLMLIGIDKKSHVGVDIQEHRTFSDKAAERVFTKKEIAWIKDAKGDERQNRFFRLWSAKEALIKAAAGGVFRHVQKIELEAGSKKLEVRKLPKDFGSPVEWSLLEFQIPGFAIACARRAR